MTKRNLRMKYPNCGHWNRVPVNKIFIEQPSSDPKVRALIPMYEPLKIEIRKNCKKVIARPKELIRIVKSLSDPDDMLKEINHRLQVIPENSFLTRLDLMFSMLLSLTIFLLGIAINHPLPKIVSAPLVGLLAIFVFTLIGLVHAIIRDDIVDRFKYWIALLFNFLMFAPYLSYWLAILLIPLQLWIIMAYLGSVFGILLVFAFVLGVNYFTAVFDRFVKRFPTRFPKYPSEKLRSIFIPTALEYLIMVASFGISYLILSS